MPLFRYKPVNPPCKICNEGFEHQQKAGEPAFHECPTCGQAVVRDVPSGVNTPKASRKPSVSEAKNAGFTVLKRTSGGEFEKQ